MDDLKNKRITVAGLGRFGGGIAVAKWLCSQGARVLVTDREPADKLTDSLRQLDGLPIDYQLGGHHESDFTQCDGVVTSPAIPPTNEFIQAAISAGVPVTTEIRLFIERCGATIVGVTATKGKSTTTTLLGLMLKTRHTVHVGGNIGGSLLFDLPSIKDSDLVVLELSSYMLEYLRPMKWSPQVALVGMISQDHLEWHGGVDHYLDAKRNIVRFQKREDHVVVSEDNLGSLEFAKHSIAQIHSYGLTGRDRFNMRLAGEHNQLNAQAAYQAARLFGVSWEEAQGAIREFAGLPHRLELVHEADGVQYVNDSIATIPEAAVAALEAFPNRRVIQIVGGYDKHLDMSSMRNALAGRAKAVLCVGDTGKTVCHELQDRAELCETLPRAVQRAKEIAQEGDVVLLSPGYPSYDQFINFQQRGEMFSKLVRETGN